MITENLLARLDLESGQIKDAPLTVRRLSDLKSSFVDQQACDTILAKEDPILYTVSSVEPASGDGQMHYGLGMIMPGKIGGEYYLTKGHLHSFRPAAEVYIGLRGTGCMLLQDEKTGESRLEPLEENTIVYVPGHTAHRTINTGAEPLLYIGVYPANAGHDYRPIADNNFNMTLFDKDGVPTLINRNEI